MERRWIEHASAVVATTDEAVDRLRRMYPDQADRIVLLPNGFDPEKYGTPPAPRLPRQCVRFVYAGALTANRSPRYFLRAMADVLGQSPDLRPKVEVRFVGFCAEEHRSEIGRLGLDDVARIEPFVAADRVPHLLREETDVALVFQREADGGDTAIPAKLFEYLAAGCVVLAMCDGGATINLLRKLDTGLLAQYDDTAEIASAIAQAVEIATRNPASQMLDREKLAQFDRREVAGRLAALIDRLEPAASRHETSGSHE
jgi:D-inositol-3-phosphate glycosyltransferase